MLNQKYNEQLDPWSSNFIGYQQKRVYFKPYNDFFFYQGVWRAFHTAIGMRNVKIKIQIKATQHLLLGKDLMKVVRPTLFDEYDEVGDV